MKLFRYIYQFSRIKVNRRDTYTVFLLVSKAVFLHVLHYKSVLFTNFNLRPALAGHIESGNRAVERLHHLFAILISESVVFAELYVGPSRAKHIKIFDGILSRLPPLYRLS